MKIFKPAFVLLFLVASGCLDEPETGPAQVKWDRDVCELCKMALSDARFAAQVRGGPKHKVYNFDDIGCAVNWLNDQPWAAEKTVEIWVTEEASSTRKSVTWLDARKAWYVPGRMSPMGYNLSATASKTDQALDFAAASQHILTNGPNHICPAP